MSVTMHHFMCKCRFLIPTLRFTSTLNIRHLPRWTHRQPVRIIGNEISEKEKEKWKLSVERDVESTSISNDVHEGNENSNKVDPGLLNRSRVQKEEPAKVLNESREFLVKDVVRNPKVDSFKVHNKIMTNSNLEDSPIYNEYETKLSSKTSSIRNVFKKNSAQKKRESKNNEKLGKSALKLGVPVFNDLGKDDKILSQYMSNLKSRKRREKVGKILLEGKRLIKDAVCAGIIPEAVFFSRINDLKYLDLPQTGVKIYKLTYQEMSEWSDVTTPQGVVGIVKTPDISKIKSVSLPLTVICDNVRDPGNMGTIIRTCAGIGCQQIIVTKGCVDIWEPKVLRSAAGGHFRVSVVRNVNWSEVMMQIPKNCRAFIAENNSLRNPESVQNSSAEEMNREKSTQTDTENSEDKCSIHSDVSSILDDDANTSLPVVPYYSCDFSGSSLVLVVGGETEGVSFNAYKLVSKTGGSRLNIPLSNKVESLNVGVALGIIGFEMKRQATVKTNICPDTEKLVDSEVAVCKV